MSLDSGWPTAVDYSDAAQDPEVCFADPRLKRGTFRMNSMGMPVIRSGQMAAVLPVEIDSEQYALRCFTTPTDHSARYRAVNAHIASRPDIPLAPAEWIDHAVAVGDGLYPAVLMPWVDGMLLSGYVDELVESGREAELKALADAWVHLAGSLRAQSVVHGDLQHGNVMVASDGTLRLIDYDGVWVPGMPTTLHEAGQPNYQHPQRMEVPQVLVEADTFAAFVIYLSLLSVAADPEMWDSFYGGENLILVREDFLEVGRHETPVWTALASSPDPDVVRHAATLRQMCMTDLRTLPTLHELVSDGVATLHNGVSFVPDRAGNVSGGSWWDGDDAQLQGPPSAAPVAADASGPAWSIGTDSAAPATDPWASSAAEAWPPVAPASGNSTMMKVAIVLLVIAAVAMIVAVVIGAVA